MQIYRQFLRLQILLSFSIFSSVNIFAQNSKANSTLIASGPSMPEMPSISTSLSPTMPRITNPTLGTKYYTPNINKTYTSQNSSKSESDKNQTKINSINSDEKLYSSAANEIQRLSSTVKKVTSGGTKLSAADLLSMNNSGLFSNVYGLLDNDEISSQEKSSETLLKSILSQLEDIKKEQENLNKKLNNYNSENSLVTYNQVNHAGEAILRFTVNGYNILDTCRTIYFSKKENDGSFLLTGDRKYYAENKLRDETFYFLFKANGNSGTAMGYEVQPAVIQDYQNTNSFLYKISQSSDLHATKTGNLISLKSNMPDLKVDLLLDIGE